MTLKKYLTQRELEAALEVAVDELQNDRNEVYITPDVDTLTDDENIDDENYSQELEPPDIDGTSELHVPDFHIDITDVMQDAQNNWNSSDEEALATKRKRLVPTTSGSVLPTPKWVKDEIQYTHSAI